VGELYEVLHQIPTHAASVQAVAVLTAHRLVTAAVPVPADQMAEYFPAGPPEGFVPMVVGGAPLALVPEVHQSQQ